MFKILTLYPRRNATRIALFEDRDEIRRQVIRHDRAELEKIPTISGQWSHRLRALEELLSEWGMSGEGQLDAVIGPAGIPGGLPGGVYNVDRDLLDRMRKKPEEEHHIDLGATLADSIARIRLTTKPFAVITLTSLEFDPISRVSGMPSLSFGKMMHALSIKNAIYMASEDLGIPFEKMSVIAAYLGKSFSICSHSEGRVRDLSNSNEQGPFSPAWSGGIPAAEIVRMAYSGMWSRDELMAKVALKGGVKGYIGTDSLLELAKRMAMGDAQAGLIYRSMAYQIASEIAAQAAVLRGKVDAILLTGGCTKDEVLIEIIKDRISWICDTILIYRSEDDLLSMANSAFRVLDKKERAYYIAEVS
jgi:butyrate kinase